MTAYLVVFLAGLAGSLHCVGMCGGFACALGADPGGRSAGATLRRHLLYNAGRVTTYVFLGSAAGTLGAALIGGPAESEPLLLAQRGLAFVAGLLMVYVGLQFAGWFRRRHGMTLGLSGQAAARALGGLLRAPGAGAPLALGVFNGFLPCPLVYAFLAHTVALCLSEPGRAAATGALTMAAFGLGTFPALLFAGWLGGLLRAGALSHAWRRRSVQLAGAFIVLLGLVTILRGALPPDGHLIHAALAEDATPHVPAFQLHKGVGGPFSLVDHHGRAVTEQDFRGRFLLIYFGYTSCPDVCPTELSKMAAALDSLGAAAAEVQPLFITVDPARDSATLLADYVAHFHPRLIGLTGSAQRIAQAQAAFGVHSSRSSADAGGGYFMNHSLLTFLLGREGRHLETFLSGTAPQAMADRIRRHVELDFVKGFLLRPAALASAYEAFAAGDYDAAFALYRGFAEQGDAAAQNNLGILYEVGAAVAPDSAAAAAWYRRAAEQGLPMGQYNLGILYGTGPSAARDSVAAYAWLALAEARGLALAAPARQAITARMSATEIAAAEGLAQRLGGAVP